MQMREPGRAVDVTRTPRRRRDPSVERLADLANDDETVSLPAAQRPEHVFPWRRKPVVRPAEPLADSAPVLVPGSRVLERRLSRATGRKCGQNDTIVMGNGPLSESDSEA